MKTAAAVIVFLSAYFDLAAQNLFANPGFEDINICTEYHAPCSASAWFPIHPVSNPVVKSIAVPEPLLGTNLLLVPVANIISPDSLPYVYTMFLCPLVKGEKYKLSFYVNTQHRQFYHLDFTFSQREPSSEKFDIAHIAPTLVVHEDALLAELKGGWRYAELEYTAVGGERFCTIGNMSAVMPFTRKERSNNGGTVFYFIDEIKMVPETKGLCAEYESNRKMVYGQFRRHTEHELVDKDADKPPKPAFRTDTLTIPDALFETSSAIPNRNFSRITDSLIALIKPAGPAKIDVIGYTDNRGDSAKNQLLSERRAATVLKYFSEKIPAIKENIFAAGKGQNFPKADNSTEKGRAINRRVEIILTYAIIPE